MIHPTAVIHPNAEIGRDCYVGPYCVIGGNVRLGHGCHLHSHVVIDGRTTIGDQNEIYPFASIGFRTQDQKWNGGSTKVEIGDRNVIRESVTIHSATRDGDATRIGSDNHLLANSHVAHDVVLEDHIVMSNVVLLAGHVAVERHAVIGGAAGVHQFCRIGRMSIVGGCSKVVQDVAPFMLADGNPARTRAINKVGLERGGVSAEVQEALRQAYRLLFRAGLTISNAVERIELEVAPSAEIRHLIRFARHSQRGLS